MRCFSLYKQGLTEPQELNRDNSANICSALADQQSLQLLYFASTCTEQIVAAVKTESRQLGNGVDSVVNPTVEAGGNFTYQWKEGKTSYCSFTERKICAEHFMTNTHKWQLWIIKRKHLGSTRRLNN